MKVTINKISSSNKLIRKCKLNKINNIDVSEPISYDYACKYEKENEDIRDLHIFCLSIAMELIEDEILNPDNKVKIKYLKLPGNKNIISEVYKISSFIINDKKRNPDKYKKNDNN